MHMHHALQRRARPRSHPQMFGLLSFSAGHTPRQRRRARREARTPSNVIPKTGEEVCFTVGTPGRRVTHEVQGQIEQRDDDSSAVCSPVYLSGRRTAGNDEKVSGSAAYLMSSSPLTPMRNPPSACLRVQSHFQRLRRSITSKQSSPPTMARARTTA